MRPRNVADVPGARLLATALLVVFAAGCGASQSAAPPPSTAAYVDSNPRSTPTAQAAAQEPPARTVQRRAVEAQLTRWRQVGAWAHARTAADVHAAPRLSSATITKLHFRTADG